MYVRVCMGKRVKANTSVMRGQGFVLNGVTVASLTVAPSANHKILPTQKPHHLAELIIQ